MDQYVEKLESLLSNVDERGYVIGRESTTLEMKENYTFPSQGKYLKTLASFANKSGGIIVFGIKDAPRIPVGIDQEKFDSIQVEKLSSFVGEYFSPLMNWGIDHIINNEKVYGFLCVEEAQDKPVICKKSHADVLREGAIYYRYRGQSKLIAYPELKSIHDEIKDRERRLWMKHIEKISKIGPQHVALIDLFQGEVETDKNKFIIQEDLLNELKGSVGFIEEGRFSEKEGAPVLRVVGEIEATDAVVVPNLDPDKDYPYFTKAIQKELGLSQYQVVALVWKYDFKGNRKYHFDAKSSVKSTVHKYSKYALQEIKKVLQEHKDDRDGYLKTVCAEYTKALRGK
ncbi:MAG: ATP-binding protein [Pseudodesulfovibrio sp.]|nr:ATP-binding protein [Pseudodesulfovibrio sp.]